MEIGSLRKKSGAKYSTAMENEESHRIFYCPRCGKQVVICRRCDRGHKYCSKECSREARRASNREAARRYQKTPKGARNHAARQKRYRNRLQSTVTHHTSPAQPITAELISVVATTCVATAEIAPEVDPLVLRCHFCGRVCGRFSRF